MPLVRTMEPSALVIASRAKAEALGSQPLARIVGYAQVATQPKYLFDAPSKAIPRLLENRVRCPFLSSAFGFFNNSIRTAVSITLPARFA